MISPPNRKLTFNIRTVRAQSLPYRTYEDAFSLYCWKVLLFVGSQFHLICNVYETRLLPNELDRDSKEWKSSQEHNSHLTKNRTILDFHPTLNWRWIRETNGGNFFFNEFVLVLLSRLIVSSLVLRSQWTIELQWIQSDAW